MTMTRRIVLLILLLAGPVWSATERYVDPDAAGAGNGTDWTNAYTSLSACLAAEKTDITGISGGFIIHLRSSGGTDDTTAVTIGTAWTTDATHPLTIQQDDAPANGVYDATKYVLAPAANATPITISEDYVRLVGLQIAVTSSSTSSPKGIVVSPPGGATSDIRISKCIIKGTCTGTGNVFGISVGASTTKIWNSIISGFVSGSDNSHEAIYCGNASAVVAVYNCTIWNNYTGIYQANGSTMTVKNCAVGNNSNDFAGTSTIANCLSDDGDGTNPQTPLSKDWDNEFTDANNGDFSLVAGGNAIGNGVDDPGSGLYSDDLIGTTRSSTWDIGAMEADAGSPPEEPPIDPAAKVTNPTPADAATNQAITVDLSWTAADRAVSYDVYFGTDSTPDETEAKGNQAGLSYEPNDLQYATTYYWRIDSVNDGDVRTTGDVWSFTTVDAPAEGTYALTITASNGTVTRVPDETGYADGALVRLIPRPAIGYSFAGWSGDISTKRLCPEIKMDGNKAVTATFQAWVPPIGIPIPPFGITETYRGYDVGGVFTRNGTLTYQASAEGGFFTHYVDNTDPAATNTSNTYGSITKPRLSMPTMPLPAGSVVEVHGGPYTANPTKISADGTAASPVFVRGPAAGTAPTFSAEIAVGYYSSLDAHYLILENLNTYKISVFAMNATDHVCVRHCTVVGHATETSAMSALGCGLPSASATNATLTYTVYYGNDVYNWGDWTSESDVDAHGGSVTATNTTGTDKRNSYVWWLDNLFYHNSGNGVQVNAGNLAYLTKIHHIYLGRNCGYENRQALLWTKSAEDVIFSQNHAWTYRKHGTAATGAIFGSQYGPNRVWFLANELEDGRLGFGFSTDDGGGGTGPGQNNFAIGNLIHNIHREPGDTAGQDPWKGGSAFRVQSNSTAQRYLLNNTIYDTDAGICMTNRSNLTIQNNIMQDVTEEHLLMEYPDSRTLSSFSSNIIDSPGRIVWGRVGDSTEYSLSAFNTAYAGKATNTLATDANLTSVDTNDFHLDAASQAIDSADETDGLQTALDLFQTTYGISIAVDADGNLRDASWDRGAYEYDPSLPPGAPTTPSPANAATGVANNMTLSWTAGDYAAYYAITLDTVTPPVAVLSSRCTSNSIASGPLEPGRVYYWQVTSCNGSGSAAGAIWSFTTETPLSVPGTPSGLSPANGAKNVTLTPTLSWSAAADAETYDIYLDTVDPPVTLLSNDQAGLSVSAGTLTASTQYYWKIIANNAAGSGDAATGSFTTRAAAAKRKHFLITVTP